jgi:hypothetical protein
LRRPYVDNSGCEAVLTSRSPFAAAKIEALKAEIVRLETAAADYRADFERECERADRLTVELLQATAEMMAAKEMTVRLEGEMAAPGLVAARPAQPIPLDKLLADWNIQSATKVEADRKACR